MSLPPKLHPVTVDSSDGSAAFSRHAVFVDYDQDTGRLTHIRIFSPALELVLDADVAAFREGVQPRMVAGRHQLDLADGRTLYLLEEGGCGCGSRLKGFNPGIPATSGWRP